MTHVNKYAWFYRQSDKGYFPRTNIYIGDRKLYMEFVAPGMKPDNISVYIEPSYDPGFRRIRIVQDNPRRGNRDYLLTELTTWAERYMNLPPDVVGNPEVSLADGMLTLVFDLTSEGDSFDERTIRLPITY